MKRENNKNKEGNQGRQVIHNTMLSDPSPSPSTDQQLPPNFPSLHSECDDPWCGIVYGIALEQLRSAVLPMLPPKSLCTCWLAEH